MLPANTYAGRFEGNRARAQYSNKHSVIRQLVVITGPTASGKTALAIELAKALGTHVISADSRQIYRDMPITTARPSDEELAAVKHHFIETLELDQYYSAAQYEHDVLAMLTDNGIDKLPSQSNYAVMCGGSMMYIDAVCNGIDQMPTITPEVRKRVLEMQQQHGNEGLLAYLQIADPDSYNRVDHANMRRVMHAIEVTIQAGRPYSQLCSTDKANRPFEIIKFVINHPREELFDRINRRVDIMVSQGMENEARQLYHLRHLNSLNTVGLKEWFAYFDGKLDRTTAIERIKKNTRVYAKKQLTWLARDPSAVYLNPSIPLLPQVLNILKNKPSNNPTHS